MLKQRDQSKRVIAVDDGAVSLTGEHHIDPGECTGRCGLYEWSRCCITDRERSISIAAITRTDGDLTLNASQCDQAKGVTCR